MHSTFTYDETEWRRSNENNVKREFNCTHQCFVLFFYVWNTLLRFCHDHQTVKCILFIPIRWYSVNEYSAQYCYADERINSKNLGGNDVQSKIQ